MSTIELIDGTKVDLFTISDSVLKLDTLAHIICNINRFSGNITTPYSVGDHTALGCLLSLSLPNINPTCLTQFLVHDMAEAIIGDVPSPVKKLCPDYMGLEQEILQHICLSNDIPFPLIDEVKAIDSFLLVQECVYQEEMSELPLNQEFKMNYKNWGINTFTDLIIDIRCYMEGNYTPTLLKIFIKHAKGMSLNIYETKFIAEALQSINSDLEANFKNKYSI